MWKAAAISKLTKTCNCKRNKVQVFAIPNKWQPMHVSAHFSLKKVSMFKQKSPRKHNAWLSVSVSVKYVWQKNIYIYYELNFRALPFIHKSKSTNRKTWKIIHLFAETFGRASLLVLLTRLMLDLEHKLNMSQYRVIVIHLIIINYINCSFTSIAHYFTDNSERPWNSQFCSRLFQLINNTLVNETGTKVIVWLPEPSVDYCWIDRLSNRLVATAKCRLLLNWQIRFATEQ